MELKRKIYQELLNWKNESKGSSALLIEGARRVGKSYIAKKFAQEEYQSYILVDFSNIDEKLLQIFEEFKNDLDTFFQYLSVYYQTKLYPRNSIIIFDEVQMYPKARGMIKHFIEDGRFDYIETGSLISIRQNVKDILIPSEEDAITLYPMDFEEFCWALGDEMSIPFMREQFNRKKPLGDIMHKKMMNLFKQYCLVGGMPQAVIKYVETKDFYEVDKVKRRILRLYRNDVTKFATGYEYKVLSIFDNIPSQLSKHEKKFKLSSLEKNARMRTYEEAFLWLSEAMVTNLCFNSTDPNVGLALSKDNTTFKCYFMDTGLLITQAFQDTLETTDNIYRAILFDKLEVNEGMIMENAVAQALRTSGHKLFFYSRTDKENQENTMEIDFIIKEDSMTKAKISPIEVKSGKGYAYRSLQKYRTKYSSRVKECYILHTKDVQCKDGYTLLPIYMAMLL